MKAFVSWSKIQILCLVLAWHDYKYHAKKGLICLRCDEKAPESL